MGGPFQGWKAGIATTEFADVLLPGTRATYWLDLITFQVSLPALYAVSI